MGMTKIRNAGKIHPLMAAAAASVIVVSLVGVAAITGLIPSSDSTTKPAAEQVAAVPAAPAVPAVTENKPAPVRHPKLAAAQPSSNHEAAKPAPKTAAAPVCEACGKVNAVRTIEQAAKPSGIGVVAGAVLGGVLGNQVGGGAGKTLSTVAGAAAGGYAGNEVEKRTRKTTAFEVDVTMEDGSSRSFSFETQPGWKAGDKVRVVNGTLESR